MDVLLRWVGTKKREEGFWQLGVEEMKFCGCIPAVSHVSLG